MAGEHDILLATTIIENGLDIPRVNTLIVNRADRFGLAQLYQLRGRVGRSERRAYAYMLVPARTPLQPLARKRLKALQEFTDLGSGFRVAAMDLEIRGAGNMLGREQSGHIAAVGFEMYCRLLDQTVREIKGEPAAPEVRAQINLGIDLKIPEEVVADFGDRLALYKRIASAADEAELGRLREEIADVYGTVPRQADNLLGVAALRQAADRLRIRSIDAAGGRIRIRFGPDAAVAPGRLVEVAARRPGIHLSPDGTLRVDLPPPSGAAGGGERIEPVRLLLQALGACASIDGPSRPSVSGPSGADA
jgi:transcription-repair coupling factor (superfamily II helicase)